MTPSLQQNFIMPPQKQPQFSAAASGVALSYTPPTAAFETAYKIIDPEVMFHNRISKLLYNAQYVKANDTDPGSLIEGYKLVKIRDLEGKEAPPKISWDGFSTIMNTYLLSVTEAASTTDFDKDFQLRDFCVDNTLAIMVMLAANRRIWKFKDSALIVPLGMNLWYNMYAIGRRSMNGGKTLSAILKGLIGYMGHKPEEEGGRKPIFWPSPLPKG